MEIVKWVPSGVSFLSFLLAARSARSAHRSSREAKAPYVLVDVRPLEPWSKMFVIVIENTGPTAARNVRITTDQPLHSSITDVDGRLHQDVTTPIPVLLPGHPVQHVFDSTARWDKNRGLPMAYTFTAAFEGPGERNLTEAYTIDLHLRGVTAARERPTHHVEMCLTNIQGSLQGINNALCALRKDRS
ncbi:hypothetical protein [Streptomyces sp. NPDC006552]|uniref:hypothetical protein n=1 Tax=Streptomyces sp. NPDC006552 TaxID=3157179 RepID=UPI0033B0234F